MRTLEASCVRNLNYIVYYYYYIMHIMYYYCIVIYSNTIYYNTYYFNISICYIILYDINAIYSIIVLCAPVIDLKKVILLAGASL